MESCITGIYLEKNFDFVGEKKVTEEIPSISKPGMMKHHLMDDRGASVPRNECLKTFELEFTE